MQHIIFWDIIIFSLINRKWRCSLLDKLMPKLTHLGGLRVSLIACLVLLIFSRGNPLAKEVILSMTSSQIIVQTAKKTLPRKRPFLTIPETNIWKSLVLKDYSFPSGHSAASFSLSTVLALYFPVIAPIMLSLAVLVGISRIYLGLHYPSDVIIGAIVGTASAIIVC